MRLHKTSLSVIVSFATPCTHPVSSASHTEQTPPHGVVFCGEGRAINEITVTAFWGVTIHLIVDWLLQNHWMATYKASLKHPAAWVHAGLHTVALLLIFPPLYALAIGVIHLLIDTRVPLTWWRKTYRQTQTGDVALHVALWGDQVLHWAVICGAAIILGAA